MINYYSQAEPLTSALSGYVSSQAMRMAAPMHAGVRRFPFGILLSLGLLLVPVALFSSSSRESLCLRLALPDWELLVP